ncbi:hypothetical protein [Profundibacter sp.]
MTKQRPLDHPVLIGGCIIIAGGRMYDTFGDYTAAWWIGSFSAIAHLPVKEAPLEARTA